MTEAKSYQRLKHLGDFASLGLTIAVLIAAVFLGPDVYRLIHPLAAENRWLLLAAIAFFYAAVLELVSLPIDFWSGFVLEHRFKLSTQSLPAWVWKRIKGYLIAGPVGLCLILGLYALIWFAGSWWWLAATLAWLAVILVLGRLVPVLGLPLFYKVTRLDDANLLARLERLPARTAATLLNGI